MIDLVLPESRLGFAAALMEMHHDRKQVFVDRFGWRLPAKGSWLEVDQFDDDYAIYLLARSPEGRHQGSVRLLPSSRPHMLSTLFSHLCPAGVPSGDDCWEISRLVTSPADASGTTILRVHRLLALALVEFAHANGITPLHSGRRGAPRPGAAFGRLAGDSARIADLDRGRTASGLADRPFTGHSGGNARAGCGSKQPVLRIVEATRRAA